MQGVQTRDGAMPFTASVPEPAADYTAALAKFALLQAKDGDEVNPVCRSKLLTHGAVAERAIVLVHGVTNCPQQFAQLGPIFFEQGYNVLVPRIPWNGYLDQSGEAMQHLTAQELRAFGDSIVDIARGLGQRVTLLGLSGGAVVTAWAAQCRADVERAVVIAPAIGIIPQVPSGNILVNRLAMRLMRVLPNMMTQRFMPIKAGPPHNYYGFATHGLAAVMQLGFAVFDSARTTRPAAQSVVMVTNEHDAAVNNRVASELAKRWQAKAAEAVTTYTFTADHALLHDIVDPTQKAQQIDYVYPILIDLATRP
jgi:alpha-beta hydrolase superfamily lysophospholipase